MSPNDDRSGAGNYCSFCDVKFSGEKCPSCRAHRPLASPAKAGELEELRRTLTMHKGISDGKSLVIAQLEARARRMEEALRVALTRCKNDMGMDLEHGPVGCAMGEKCECVAVYATLLSPAALSDSPASAARPDDAED